MEFSEALEQLGRPAREIQQEKTAAVQAIQAELAGDVEAAKQARADLEAFFNATVRPFIAQIEERNLRDNEINGWLFELGRLLEKPQEIRRHMQDLQKIEWAHIRQIPFPDKLDQAKRDNLVRHYRGLLTRFGDFEGSARRYMGLIQSRVLEFAERGHGQGQAVELRPPEEEELRGGVVVKRSVRRHR